MMCTDAAGIEVYNYAIRTGDSLSGGHWRLVSCYGYVDRILLANCFGQRIL